MPLKPLARTLVVPVLGLSLSGLEANRKPACRICGWQDGHADFCSPEARHYVAAYAVACEALKRIGTMADPELFGGKDREARRTILCIARMALREIELHR